MKKYYLLLFIFSFILRASFAQIYYSTTSDAIALPSGNFQSDYFFDSASNEMKFSFVADRDRMTFTVMHSANYTKSQNITIDSLLLYNRTSNGDKLVAFAMAANANSDSLPAIQILNLVPGNSYYLRLTKFDKHGLGYFNLSKIVLHPAIIPSPCVGASCTGTNLICNGDFETIPGWAIGNCYADSSITFPNNPANPATVGYCMSSPNVRNNVCLFGGADFTDVYVISNYMSSNFQNTAEHGTYFMGIDCPSTECNECSPTNTPGYIWTPNYSAIAWKQTISVSNSGNYKFSCWLEDLDNNEFSYIPATTAYIVINSDTLFSDIISYGNGYGSWKEVSICWLANSSTADIKIIGQGNASYFGYDLGIDNIAFATNTSLTISNSTSNVTCSGGNNGSATISISGGVSPYTYSWAPNGGTNATETGLSAGTYTITLNDFNGCETTDTIVITQPNTLLISTHINSNVLCNGNNTAALHVL